MVMKNNSIELEKLLRSFEIGFNESEDSSQSDQLTSIVNLNSKMKNRMSRLLYVVNNISQGIFVTDVSSNIIWANPSAIRMSGYLEGDLIGSNMRILKSDRHDQRFYEDMWKEINEFGVWEGEIWNRKKNGMIYLQWAKIFAVKNELGLIVKYTAICTDLSEKENFLAEMNRSSFYDNLTGLPNKAQLKKQISDVTDQQSDQKRKHYFVALNVDRFSYVNMSYGYGVGDQLLIDIGKRISRKLRDVDSIFRYSGDLFILLFRDVPNSDILITIVNRIIELVNVPFEIQGQKVTVTASYGISLYPDDGLNYDTLLKNAEIALREAKDSGKNSMRFFSHAMNEKASRWFALGNELQQAITNNDLRVYYQIQVENGTGIIKGAEALIRWDHKKFGILGPSEFIPYAEVSGLIIPLGYWIIEHTFMLIKDFHDRNLPTVKYAINLSYKQITEKDLVDNIIYLAEKYNIDSAQVEFEITESGAMKNSEETLKVFSRLKDMGFTLAIDDFGTGYSSLSYLSNLPVDVLKIDRSFITQINQKENQKRLTIAILSMAETIGLRTVAEGVETIKEVEFLRDKKCDLLQGYYYSKPVNAEKFEKLLLNQVNSLNAAV